jgi:serine phosphatase RsbU (regulator of sigma subunit)
MVQAQRWRLPMRPASLITLLVTLGITVAGTWATDLAVRGQERLLLKERTAEVGLVLNSAIAAIPEALNEQATVLRVSDGSRTAYEKTATTAAAAAPGALTYAWVRRAAAGGFVVLAEAGPALHDGQVIDDDRTTTLEQALSSDTLVASRVVSDRRLLFALGPPAAPAGTVLYREQMLGPVAPPRQAGTAPFSELEVTLYATPDDSVPQVLVSTTKQLPLTGSVHRQLLDVGDAKWLLAVKARRPLVGSLTSKAPWFTLAAGVLGALLIAAVVEISARRRNSAISLYETEHQVAETLQRSLLPALPDLPGLDLAARYIASGAGQQVGGDWFDVFPIAGARVGLVVGDVIGHDLTAASEMAQIRSALRAYAVDGDPPAEVITRLDRLVDALRLTQLVTVFYGVLDPPDPDGGRLLHYSNAGHLPPIVRRADGRIETIADGSSAVLGAPMAIEHNQDALVVSAGDVLVMFTDGLVEVPGGSLDDGLARLGDTIAAPGGEDAEAMCEQVLVGMTPSTLRDDIALLAVRITASAEIRVESSGVRA